MNLFKNIDIEKYKNGFIDKVSDNIIIEYILKLFINNVETTSFFCTPSALKYLVAGYLQSQSIIERKEDIKKISINENEGKAEAEISKEINISAFQNIAIMSSGEKNICMHEPFKIRQLKNDIKYNLKDVIKLVEKFNNRSNLFNITGGVHSCAAADGKNFIIFQEDIGRHNAVDKVLGQALLEGIDLKDKIIFTSGRISSEMLLKAAKGEVPMVVSVSAPTALSVELARKLNITLAGFARGDRMNLYSCSERLIW